MSEDRSKRIRELVDKSGLSVRELARRIGVSNVSIGKWLHGQNVPSGRALDSFCSYFDVSPSFVLFGEGGGNQGTSAFAADTISIPLYDVSASCGSGAIVDSPESIIRSIRVSKEFLRRYAPAANPNSLNIISITGDSMSPTIEDGDSVIVDTSDKIVRRDGLYAVQMNGMLFVKRIQILPTGLRIISDNPHYPPIEVSGQDTFVVIGRCYAAALLRSMI